MDSVACSVQAVINDCKEAVFYSLAMRIPDAERATILADVGGNVADCSLVCAIIETMYQSGRDLSFDVSRISANAHLIIRLADGFDIFTSANAKRLWALSQRIHDIRLVFSKKRIVVTVTPDGGTRPQWQRVFVRNRAVAIDYAAARITAKDDVSLIDAIVTDAYAMAERMPDMRFFIEPIVDGQAAVLQHTGMEIPLTGKKAHDSEDASESSMGGSMMPESARIGYSLCFSNVPDIGADFFHHLHETYGIRIAAAYGWMTVSPPMLVVNIRRISVPATTIVQKVVNHLPRPLKHAGKKRSGADEGSHSTSMETRARRARAK